METLTRPTKTTKPKLKKTYYLLLEDFIVPGVKLHKGVILQFKEGEAVIVNDMLSIPGDPVHKNIQLSILVEYNPKILKVKAKKEKIKKEKKVKKTKKNLEVK